MKSLEFAFKINWPLGYYNFGHFGFVKNQLNLSGNVHPSERYLEIHFPYNRSDKIQVRLFYFFGQNDGLDCKYVHTSNHSN